jgi:DNA-binding transcriptional LysR family regulator
VGLIERHALPDLGAVWTFRAVVQAGAFSKGAASLGLTQAGASAAIRRLERELGHVLFVRVGRRNHLTDAGRELLSVAGPALNDWARIGDRVDEALEGRPRGSLRVGAGESSLLYLLPAAVSAYRRKCPDVTLTLLSQPYEDSLGMLRDGSLDIAVRSLSRATPGVSSHPLREVRRVFIASTGGPRLGRKPSLAELAKLPFVLPHRGSTTRAALETAMAKERLTCRVALEAGSWEAVKLYVSQGLGVGLVPEIVVGSTDRRRLATTRAGHLFASESYGILRPEERPLSRAAQAMMETLQAHCASHA